MSTDLHLALTEIADQAERMAPNTSVNQVLTRRRRRRIAVRSARAGGLLVVGAGVALAVSGLTGLRPAPVLPAAPTSIPSATENSYVVPTCGYRVDGLPVELDLELAGAQEYDLGTALTMTAAVNRLASSPELTWTDADSLTLVLVQGNSVVVAVPNATTDGMSTEPTYSQEVTSTLAGCGTELAAGDYQLIAILTRAEGTSMSVQVPVVLTDPTIASPDATANAGANETDTGASLPDPYALTDIGTSFASDPITSAWPLPDGRYLLQMANLDLASRSFDATMYQMLSGDRGVEWAQQNNPDMIDTYDGQQSVPNGYVLLESTFGVQRLTIPENATMTGIRSAGGEMKAQSRTLGQLAIPELSTDPEIWESGPEDFYWIDVRDGQIRQLVGQFLP